MKKLRPYYERELGAMQGLNAEFAAEFPAQAGQLGMAAGKNDDPHIERFAQATALSNARTAQLIADNDVKVTEALLSINYPHLVRPFPSTAIVWVDMRAGLETMTAAGNIARGTMLSAKTPHGPLCKFQTVYDVPLTPVVLSQVTFQPLIDVPLSLTRPADVTAALCITIECKAANLGFAQLQLERVRPFIDAEQSLCATTRDVLFMHARAAWLELDDGRWIALESVPVAPVGFAPDEAVVPYPAASHPAYRLLAEYFVCPEKFNFFDIVWPSLAPYLSPECRRLTLHLGLAGIPADSHVARSLAQLSNKNFVLGCTPMVNLFKRSARPFELTHTATDYELIADGGPAEGYDIHSVDKVYSMRTAGQEQQVTEFRPYYSLRHGEAGGRQGRYYLLRRDPVKALSTPGHELRIALVDLDLDPLAIADTSVSVDLSCTNRDLPTRLPYGAAAGDLTMERAAEGFPLRLLRRPTPQYRFGVDSHWCLISHLSLSHCSLAPDGLERLKELLTLYDLPQSPVSQRQTAGMMALEQRPARTWLDGGGNSCLVHGIEIRITLDEDAYAGTGIHLFATILAHFFGMAVHLNSYAQLTILSHSSGKELLRCPPRSGALQLV